MGPVRAPLAIGFSQIYTANTNPSRGC